MEHQVLFLRGQHITRDQHKEFARRFGDLHVHPVLQQLAGEGHPEIVVLESNEKMPYVADAWHSDVTFERKPPMGSILRAVVAPEYGGDTLWASMYAAYEALSDSMQRLLSGLRARHAGDFFNYVAKDDAQRQRAREGQRRGAPGDPHAPGDGPQGDLRELDLHEVDRGHEARREPRAARLPLRARGPAGLQRALPLGDGLDRDVGQPLHAAPRACATASTRTGAWSA